MNNLRIIVCLLLAQFLLACDSDNLVIQPEQDQTIVGFTAVPLDANKRIVRGQEAVIGNLITDALVYHASNNGYSVDFAIVNGGSIRFSDHLDGIYPIGNLSRNDTHEMMPFGNTGVVVTMTGEELKSTLERGYYSLPLADNDSGSGSFLQLSSALQVEVKIQNQPQIVDEINQPAQIISEGDRIVSIKVSGQNIEMSNYYYVIMPDYMATGGDGFVQLRDIPQSRKIDIGIDLSTAIEDYLQVYSPVTPIIEARITIE